MTRVLVVATGRKTRGGITSVVKAHETACLTAPECAVKEKCEQDLCIQWTFVDKSCHLFLGEDSQQSLQISFSPQWNLYINPLP